jgi:hypothetical protein
MPFSIDEIRQANGGLSNLTDEDILQYSFETTGKRYYDSIDSYAQDMGYEGAGRGKWGARGSAAVDQYQAGLLGLGEAVTGAVGLTGASEYLGKQRRANESAAQFANRQVAEQGGIQSFEDVQGVGDLADYVGGLAVQSAPYMAEALAGGLVARGLMTGTRAALAGARTTEQAAAAQRALNTGSTVGAAAASYPSAVGDILQSQRDQAGETNLLAAGGLGVPYAALNAVGIEGALARGTLTRSGIKALDAMTGVGGVAARTGASATKTGFVEGVAETGQEAVNQLGRMSVDEAAQFLSPEALERYKESFIAGGLLGGTFGAAGGGWRRTEEGGLDLTQKEEPVVGLQDTGALGTSLTGTEPSALMGSPLASALGESAQTLPLGQTLTTGTEGQTAEELLAATETKNPAVQILTPAQQRLIDNGINPYQRGASKKATEVLDKIQASGLSEDVVAPVLTLLQQSKFKGANDMLARLYAENQLAKAANASTTTGAVPVVAGGVGEQRADVGAGMEAAGPAPTGVTRPVGGVATGTGAGVESISAVPVPSGELAAPVAVRQRAPAPVPAAQPLVDTSEDALEIARMTGNASALEAEIEDAAGLRADREDAPAQTRQQVIAEYLKDSQTPERDAQIVDAYLTALQDAPKGSKRAVQKAIGDQFGVSESRVRQLGNPQSLADAGVRLGMDRAAVFELFNATDNKKTGGVTNQLEYKLETLRAQFAKAPQADKAAISAEMAATNEQLARAKERDEAGLRLEVSEGLRRTGVEVAQGETSGMGGMDDDGQWRLDSARGSKEAVDIVALADDMQQMRQALERYEAQGLAEPVALITKKIATAQEKLDALLASDKPASAPKQEVSADLAAAKKKFKDAKLDVTKMEPAELQLLRGEASRLKNQPLVAKIDAQLAATPTAAPGKVAQIIDMNDRLREKADTAEDEAGFTELAGAVAAENAPIVKEAASKLRGLNMLMERAEKALAPRRDPEGRVIGLTTAVQLNGYLKEYIAISEDADAALAGQREGADLVARAEAISSKEALADIKELAAELEAANKESAEMANYVETPFVAAARAWDNEAQTYDNAPLFENLTKDQQQEFIEFGEANWGPADVTLALAKIQKETVQVSTDEQMRKVQVGERARINTDTTNFDVVRTSLERLRRYPGVGRALAVYEASNLKHLLDSVDYWLVADESVDFDAAVFPMDGKRALAIRAGVLAVEDSAFISMHHEIGHIADNVYDVAGAYSKNVRLALNVSKDRVLGVGAVAREVVDYFNASPDTELGKHFSYPLKSAGDTITDNARMREEIFAQLWAARSDPILREELADMMPTAFDFIEAAYEAEQSAASKPASTGSQAAATEAAAQPQADQGDIRATRSVQQADIRRNQRRAKGNIDRLPAVARPAVEASWDFITDWGNRALDRVVFTSDLVDNAVRAGIPSARKFLNTMAASRSFASEMEREVEMLADGYALIEEKDKGRGPRSMNQFLFESTRMGKWGYKSGSMPVDPEMAVWFNELGPKSQKFVKDVFAHGDSMLSKKKQIVLEATTSEYDGMIEDAKTAGDTAKVASLKKEKAAALTKFTTLFRVREGKPYAPIKRTGSHVVFAKSAAYIEAVNQKDTKRIRELEQNGDDYQVTFAESKSEARRLARELDASGLYSEVDFAERSEAVDNMFTGEALLPALTKLRSRVGDVDERSAQAKMREIVNQLYLEALAEASARKSEMRRRGVSGQVDMLQSFAIQGRADAQFLASVKYSPKIQEDLRSMDKESKRGDRARKSELRNEILTRYLNSLDYKVNPWVDGLTSLSSKYFLATSPGYYLQNLTQPFMMSLPAMAGSHDYTKAGKELYKAYTELGPIMKATKLFDQQFDFDKVPADVAVAIKQLVAEGKIDIGLATEISEYKIDADNKLTNFASKLNKGMRLAVQKAEAINRLSTAMAAYRLEFAKTKDAAKATEYAGRILTETHGDYTAFNAPRAFNSNLGKVMLQFRKFQLIQLTFYTKLIRDAYTNPKERAAALKTLGYTLGHTAVFAGMMGMPGYAAIAAITSALGDEDEPFDMTKELRALLGPEWATVVLRGAPTLADVDLSGKIGYGNMLSVMPFSNADLGTAAGRAEALGTLMGGASLGMATRVADGLGLMTEGDWYKGIERTMPKGISDMMKAGRTATDGMTRRNGDVILPADEVNTLGAIFSSIGLPSAAQAVVYENRQQAYNLKSNFTDRTTKIKQQYVKAYRDKDQAGIREAREAWAKLQDAKRRNGVKVSPVSDLIRAPRDQAKRERDTVGGVQFTGSNRAMAQQIAQ